MSKYSYICKCGRTEFKSANAYNTGNRNTSGCDGCPYLLPYGPTRYIDGQGFVMDVQGYECRMSPTLTYASTYRGTAKDKCVLTVVSLDLDFLDEVQAWIYDNANETLKAGFSRGSIRPTDYSDEGRYALSVYCAQNRKGMAAKASLLARFFGPGGHRLDMTPQQEKAHILAAIEASKARAQKKEESTVIYKDPATGWLYRVGPEPYQDSYWVYYMDPKSSAFWKRCPQNSLYAGNKTAEGEEEYLRLNAKRNGWVPVEDAPGENPTDAAEDAQPCAPIASDAPLFPSPSANADVQQGGKDDAANPTDAAPASPADAGAATQSLSAADPASLAAESAQLAFDYSGLDDQTVADLHLAEREYAGGKKMAEMGLRRMADAVAIAHDALRVTDATICRTGGKFASPEQSFSSWCESMGLNRKAAERLLQVSKLMDNSSPREQKVLEELSPSLLYAAAKPSAPAELVQAVKDGDITTHKQYQEAMAMLKERDAKIQELLEMSEAADRRADEAQAWAKKAESDAREAQKERDGARDALQAAKRRGDQWQEKAEARQARLQELENRPIQATAVDSDEVDRMVTQRLEEELAKQMPRQQEEQEQAARDAYDAFILTARSLDNLWRTLKPQITRLAPDQKNGAKNLLLQKLMEVKEELIHACEDHQP